MKNVILYTFLLFIVCACQQPQSICPLLEKADCLLISNLQSLDHPRILQDWNLVQECFLKINSIPDIYRQSGQEQIELNKAESIQDNFDVFCIGHYLYVMISLLVIALFVCLYIIYWNRFQKRVLFTRHAVDVILKREAKLKQNEAMIREKVAMYNALFASSQTENENKQQQLDNWKKEIAHLKAENERLNQEIAEQKRKYIVEHSLKSGKEIRKAVLLLQLKERPVYIEKEQWTEIFLTVDILFDNFTKRLKDAYPDLSNIDLQYCCLFKAGFSIQQIAVLLMVDPKSVSRRKIEIRKHMHLEGKVDVEKLCKKF